MSTVHALVRRRPARATLRVVAKVDAESTVIGFEGEPDPRWRNLGRGVHGGGVCRGVVLRHLALRIHHLLVRLSGRHAGSNICFELRVRWFLGARGDGALNVPRASDGLCSRMVLRLLGRREHLRLRIRRMGISARGVVRVVGLWSGRLGVVRRLLVRDRGRLWLRVGNAIYALSIGSMTISGLARIEIGIRGLLARARISSIGGGRVARARLGTWAAENVLISGMPLFRLACRLARA
jgi:hypothetical protein